MSALGISILKLFSRLPFWLWYVVAFKLYILIYHVVGYRKKVVFNNLKNSFPNKSPKELKEISRKFYRHFCQVLVENIKLISLSQKQLQSRISFKNTEVLDKYAKNKQSVILVMGHYGNWEFLEGLPFVNQHLSEKMLFKGIYKVQKNKAVDALLLKSRSKNGLHLVPSEKVNQSFKAQRNMCTAMVFLGDQSPSNAEGAHWTTFLNQDTGILMGTERYAKIFDLPVIYLGFKQMGKGKYCMQFTEICENPKATQKGFISEKHHQLLEKDIQEHPEFWLWTHKRWKKKKPAKA